MPLAVSQSRYTSALGTLSQSAVCLLPALTVIGLEFRSVLNSFQHIFVVADKLSLSSFV